MDPIAIKKLSDKDLISLIDGILKAEQFMPEDALTLKRATDEAQMRKSVLLGGAVTESKRLSEPCSCFFKRAPATYAEINLTVLDKESISEIKGLRKFTLGYALDNKLPHEGENMLHALDAILPGLDCKVGSVICVKVGTVRPFVNGHKLYEVEVKDAFAFEPRKDKPFCSKEIIRKAFKADVLTLDPDTAADLTRQGIIKVDVDHKFGVKLDKQISFSKGQSFGKYGVVYAVVYPVDDVDTDGDSANAEEVMKACWKFMEDYQSLNFMHKDAIRPSEVSIVECATALADSQELGIKKGDWYMAVKVKDQEMRKLIESGEITGFSMEGSAIPA